MKQLPEGQATLDRPLREESQQEKIVRLERECELLRRELAGARDKYLYLDGVYQRLADTWNAFQGSQEPKLTPRNVQRAEASGELARKLAEVFIGLAYKTRGLDDLIQVLLRLRPAQPETDEDKAKRYYSTQRVKELVTNDPKDPSRT